ncbi:MAG: hypothetical protein R3C28_31910 [Pirellulaceae bacterium]
MSIQFRSKRRKQITQLSLCFSLLLVQVCWSAEVTLFDHLDPLRDPDADASRWRTWPTESLEWLVQPFLTGNANNVASVTIDFLATGNPQGELTIEIWDDNGKGQPGNVVGVVGSLDLADLDGAGDGIGDWGHWGDWEFITFDDAVSGLLPNSTYYVVLNSTDTVIDGNNTFANGSSRSDEGTFGAGVAMGGPQEGWEEIRRILNNANLSYFDMTIIANDEQLHGDFDQNGLLTSDDIDRLTAELRDPTGNPAFDINNDDQLTSDDYEYWVHNLAHTYFGDANLDGEFNSSDMTLVFSAAEYEDNITLNSTWAEGDWNGDGDFDSSDLILAFQDGGYEQGPRADVQAVPEPSSVSFVLLCLPFAIRRLRRTYRN